MLITYERASKQAGWKGDAFEDRITVRGYESDKAVETRDWRAELIIEEERFDTIADSIAVKITIFSDAVGLLASGRLVRGLRNIEDAISLDVAEAELASAGLAELVLLTEGGAPRVIDH